MFRFSDFLVRQAMDYWRTYFGNKDVIHFLTHVSSILGAKTAGYPMLQAYDIMDIANHLPGKTVVWEPVLLSSKTEDPDSEYRYVYSIDKKWLQIVTLHDKLTDPTITYQNNVDFTLTEPGKIAFIHEPAELDLVVAKGQVADTLLADNFGTAFGYTRQDSYYYRDTMLPLMALFMLGPTAPLLTAGFNIMIGNPVLKYGKETVKHARNGLVWTDKYQYNMGGATLSYTTGDVVGAATPGFDVWPEVFPQQTDFQRFKPLADAVTLITQKTNPEWYTRSLPQIFQKYSDAPLTMESKNRLMDLFLKYFVAMVRIRLDRVTADQFVFQPDVKELVLDAAPIRTDFIFLMEYNAEDIIPFPDGVYDHQTLRSSVNSIWGNHKGAEMFWLYAPEVANAVIYPDGLPASAFEWGVNSRRYHILYKDQRYFDFWSEVRTQMPYVEPGYDDFFYHQPDTPTLPSWQDTALDIISDTPQDFRKLVRVGMGFGPQSDLTPVCSEKQMSDSTSSATILAEVFMDVNDLRGWALDGSAVQTFDGISTPIETTGEGTSGPVQLGRLPKNVTITLSDTKPMGTTISYFFSVAGSPFLPLPADCIVRGVVGELTLRAALTASTTEVPTLRNVIFQLHSAV